MSDVPQEMSFLKKMTFLPLTTFPCRYQIVPQIYKQETAFLKDCIFRTNTYGERCRHSPSDTFFHNPSDTLL